MVWRKNPQPGHLADPPSREMVLQVSQISMVDLLAVVHGALLKKKFMTCRGIVLDDKKVDVWGIKVTG